MTRPAEVSIDELRGRIERLPRLRLAALPTACEELPRLAQHVGVRRFLVKRDDLTGLGLGGNKSRTMEFVLGEAVAQGCDILIAGGGVEQSNHARQCVAAATRAGMDAVVVLQRREQGFRPNGNLLALQLLGGDIRWLEGDPTLSDRHAAGARMQEIAAELTAAGRRPYVLVSSVHPLGVVAYVEAAIELAGQLGSGGATARASEHRSARGGAVGRTRIYAASEGAVLGGLVLATRALGLPWDIVGVDWRPEQLGTPERLADQVSQAATLLGLSTRIAPGDLRILPGGGPAYGEGSPESWAALDLVARLEGLLLDPVYTAKGMAGALADLRSDPAGDAQVVFVHTGGVPALFAYPDELERYVLNTRVLSTRPDSTAAGREEHAGDRT